MNLAMSAKAVPLFEAVTKFIRDEIDPVTEKFFKLGEGRPDRWQYAPGQLELLEGLKNKAKANGLWNFFLPNAETGEGHEKPIHAHAHTTHGRCAVFKSAQEVFIDLHSLVQPPVNDLGYQAITTAFLPLN